MAGFSVNIRENSSTTCVKEEDSSDSSECESELEEGETYPTVEPLYDGKEIQIDPTLVEKALSAISFRHLPQGFKFGQSKKRTIQERNSFYNIHRPELKTLNWARNLPEESRKEAVEKIFLEIAKENENINHHSTELTHQRSTTNIHESFHGNADPSNTASKENKKEPTINYEKSHVLLIMAPVQMQNHSDESIIWAMNDMREACSLETQEEKRIGRDTGGGEEGEFEDKSKLCHAALGSSAGPTTCL